MTRISVFISGTGYTLHNLLTYAEKSQTTEIVFVGSHRECEGLKYARERKIPIQANPEVANYVCEISKLFDADLICLAGYIKKVHVRKVISCNYENRIMNIHPSLLPAYGGMYGKKVHEAVLASAEEYSGCTVHLCDGEYDHGPIILQRKVKIEPDWDTEQLAAAIFEQEKIAYPAAIESFKESYDGQHVDIKCMQHRAQISKFGGTV